MVAAETLGTILSLHVQLIEKLLLEAPEEAQSPVQAAQGLGLVLVFTP